MQVRSASASAWRWPSVTANCLATEKLIAGGGQCSADYSILIASIPNGNGWFVACDTPNQETNYAYAYAICAVK